MADWSLYARTPGPLYASNGGLPLSSASVTVRHLGVSAGIVTTPYTPQAWGRLGPSAGVELWRNGRREFGGLITERRLTWDAASAQALIKLSCLGDEQVLADRLVFPEPGKAPDDQQPADYWTFTGTPSAAMLRLISDQAGPTCLADRRVPGLTVAQDPGVGAPRAWQGLFTGLLDTLAVFSVSSGSDLGVRVTPAAGGGLLASLFVPRDLTASIRFSADLSNLVGLDYVETAPTVTDSVAAGQGDLHLRLRRYAATSGPLALSWGRRIWRYVDRRDTADVADLDQANADEIADGAPTVSLAVDLTDSQAAKYGRDWGLGDKITIYVGLPGQAKVATVSDVVREIRFDVADTGAETLRPAIGTADAKAVIPPPSIEQLAAVGRSLTGLITRK